MLGVGVRIQWQLSALGLCSLFSFMGWEADVRGLDGGEVGMREGDGLVGGGGGGRGVDLRVLRCLRPGAM